MAGPDGFYVAQIQQGQIHIKKLDVEGGTVWEVSMPDAQARYIEMARDDAGGAVVGWQQEAALYLQKISSDGKLVWEDGGGPVSAASDSQVFAGIIPGDAGVIVVWQDRQEIYAQRLDTSGSYLWKADGVRVGRASENLERARAVRDHQGGVVVIWQSSGAPGMLHAQRVDSQGNLLWREGGILVSERVMSGGEGAPRVIDDGEGGAVVVWGSPDGLYVQRVGSEGQLLWSEKGVRLAATTSTPGQKTVTRGPEGFLIGWAEPPQPTVDFPEHWALYVEKLDPMGMKLWEKIPVFVSSAPDDNVHGIDLVDDGASGAIVTWQASKTARGGNIWIQCLDEKGRAQWMENGVSVYPEAAAYLSPQLVRHSSGKAFILSLVGPSLDAAQVRAQAISPEGELLWSSSGKQVFP